MKRINTILKQVPKMQTMKSNNGNDIPNQLEIFLEDGKLFSSYNTNIVLKLDDGRILLDEKYYNYSNTTVKYRNRFLREDTKEIEAKIKSGEYTLTNLN